MGRFPLHRHAGIAACRFWVRFAAVASLPGPAATGAVVSPKTDVLGEVPEVLGCNAGHLYPGGNTIDWWRYSGANGARVFISPSDIEPSDDLAPHGDGVADEAGFMARRAALRADPLNQKFIQWSVFEANFANRDLHPVNHIKTDEALTQLRQAGIATCAQITAGAGRFPLAGPQDWPGLWELWQHYYAQAFHLARRHEVRRFQIYNEPDAVPVPEADFLLRLRVGSDAIQCAVADVNARYGGNLVAQVHAPVNAGSASSDFTGGLGGAAVAARHHDVRGVAAPPYTNVHIYDYHQYDGSPGAYASSLAGLHGLLDTAMAPQPRLPTCISEFNVHTASNFDGMAETLDSPVKYARLGAILTRLAAGGIREMHLFKFSQTLRGGGNYPVAKNALHYTDNANAPYAIGGITQAGEVWRLFNKASAAGGLRLAVNKDAEAAALEVQATWHPQRDVRHLYCVNNTSQPLPLTLDFGAWPVVAGAPVRIEEVGEACRGAVAAWTRLDATRRVEGLIGPYTVWLVTLPASGVCQEDVIAAAADATVRDGTRAAENSGTATVLEVRNDPAAPSPRSAALLRFDLPPIHPPDVIAVTLAAELSTSAAASCQAHVHGLDEDGWEESTVTWGSAPNLRQNLAAGSQIRHAVTLGGGTSAHFQGQWQANPGPAATARLDVTGFFRAQSDRKLSFLVVQDPRWDVALPSLEPGDIQPGGLRIASREASASAMEPPRLHVVRKTDTDRDGISDEAETREFGTSPLRADTDGDGVSDGVEILVDHTDPRQSSGLPVSREASIRGGSSAGDDVAESTYLMVKHSSDLNFCRKSYFQFDLPAGTVVDPERPATFWLRFTQSYPQRVRLWGLTGEAPAIASSLTWNSAPGHDPVSNGMLADRASPIGPSVLIEPGTTLPRPPRGFSIPRIGDFLTGRRITLVLCPEADPSNHSSGLRIEPATASLDIPIDTGDGLTPFEQWKQASFANAAEDPVVAGDAADPDGDGAVNLLEYALGGDPLSPASRGLQPVLVASPMPPAFSFELDPARDDIVVTVQQAGSPLGPWTGIATTTASAGLVALDPGVNAVSETVGSKIRHRVGLASLPANSRGFLRLRITRTP